jgi:hypothetical protein
MRERSHEITQRQTPDTLPKIDPEIRSMYEIPGSPAISAHTWDRYQRDSERDMANITDLIKTKEKKGVDPNFEQLLLETENLEIKLHNLQDVEKKDIIREYLLSSSPSRQVVATKLIPLAPLESRAGLVDMGLGHSNPDVQEWSASSIHSIVQDKIVEYIKKGLVHKNKEVQISSAKTINEAPEEERTELIRIGITHTNPEVQNWSAQAIWHAPEEDKIILIHEAISHPNPDVVYWGVSAVSSIPEYEITPILDELLLSSTPLVSELAAKHIMYAPLGDRVELISTGLDSTDMRVQMAAAEAIRHAPIADRGELIELVKEKGLLERVFEAPLYHNNDIPDDRFSRKQFEKTGSETTLLGGDLKYGAIVRHIEPKAFVEWKKLYDNHELWKKNDFDYIPIEPILSFHLSKKTELVDVYSGVLDISLATWMRRERLFGTDYSTKLMSERERIINIVESADVSHGHDHEENFVLRFFRDKNGDIDLTKEPRIYMIDFDEAKEFEYLDEI